MPPQTNSLPIEYVGPRTYLFDLAGDLGVKKRAPTLTNLSDALIVSSHGMQRQGFSPDKSATNELASVIQRRLDEGGEPLSLREIANTMGSATNDVKRVIIDACFAAGHNYNTVKKLFPNLEQLIAPSTDRPTSAKYVENLVYKTPTAYQYGIPSVSPFFNITDKSTNLIRKASDWTSDNRISIPLPKNERYLVDVEKKTGLQSQPISTNYSGVPYGSTFTELKNDAASILQWQKDEYERMKREKGRISDEDFERIDTEVKQRLNSITDQ